MTAEASDRCADVLDCRDGLNGKEVHSDHGSDAYLSRLIVLGERTTKGGAHIQRIRNRLPIRRYYLFLWNLHRLHRRSR